MLAARFDPLVAVVDGEGRVKSQRLPEEYLASPAMCDADHISKVAPAPVVMSWMQLIRAVANDGKPRCGVVIMKGEAHELWVRPAKGSDSDTASSVVLTLLPGGLRQVPRRLRAEYERVAVTGHDWGPLEPLSRSELNVLRLIALGMTNTEAAALLHRTRRAVEWHVRHLHRTLHVSTRPSLVATAHRAGLHCFTDHEWEQLLSSRPAVRNRPDPSLDADH